MMYGMSGAPIAPDLPYAQEVTAGCSQNGLVIFPPIVAYAIAWHESIGGQVNGLWPSAATVVSGDGGHGLFQLTSYVPPNWADPLGNTQCAVHGWLAPDTLHWISAIPGIGGDDLIRCVAASFNAGWGGAWQGHMQGDVGRYTTDRYPDAVLRIYHNLATGGRPQ